MQKSPQVTEIELPADVLAHFAALPDAKPGHPKAVVTPEQDAILLKYWPVKRKDDVAAIVGHGRAWCRDRYKELTEGT